MLQVTEQAILHMGEQNTYQIDYILGGRRGRSNIPSAKTRPKELNVFLWRDQAKAADILSTLEMKADSQQIWSFSPLNLH